MPKPPKKPQTPNSTPDVQAGLLALLGPLLEFHKSAEEATDNDLRIFWDIRIVSGKDTQFLHNTGSSSMPSLLEPSMRQEATARLEQVVNSMILRPLIAKMQSAVEAATIDHLTPAPGMMMLLSPESSSTDSLAMAYAGSIEPGKV